MSNNVKKDCGLYLTGRTTAVPSLVARFASQREDGLAAMLWSQHGAVLLH